MKKLFTATLLSCLLFSANISSFAQKNKKSVKQAIIASDAVSEQRAYTDGRGVWISWETASVNNVRAFNIFRITGSGREIVNPELIVRVPAKQSYFDRNGEIGAVYEIESVKNDGARSVSANFATEYVSKLEDIPGIGPRRRGALLKHFGGLAALKEAGSEEIARVAGVNAALAARIYASLHGLESKANLTESTQETQ